MQDSDRERVPSYNGRNRVSEMYVTKRGLLLTDSGFFASDCNARACTARAPECNINAYIWNPIQIATRNEVRYEGFVRVRK